jgi:hypothetical protein
MFYLIYKITNKLDGKIYIGSHKTKNIDDNYMGSGKYLNHAYKKHGLENFVKEILFLYDNAKDMYAKEAEIVNEDFLAETNTYNLKKGGFGGFDYINDTGKNLYGKNGQPGYGGENLHKSITAKRMKQQGRYLEYVNKISNRLVEKYASGELVSNFAKNNPMHDPKLKQKQKEALQKINHQQGDRNSQYGTCWVTHKDLGNKKIKKEMLNEYISLGYTKGRVLNNLGC